MQQLSARSLPQGRAFKASSAHAIPCASKPIRSRSLCRTAAPSAPPTATAETSPWLENIQFMNPMWASVTNEHEFFTILKGFLAKVPGGPEKLLPQWQDFYNNYKAAVTGSGLKGANELLVAKVQATIADTVTLQFMQPYTFPSHHHRMLEPYNYYEFGQRYVGTLTNMAASVLGHAKRWDRVAELLAQGHNVVLLANHQTEADPGVFAHMLTASHPNLATDVIYVAGDRVVTDPLSKPFSMGRNLFCVHSKKHLDDIPELKASKMETNRKTLVAMQRALNKGGALVWIAPSGGRDRPKADDRYSPDPFDGAAVELMRNLAARAKQPGHLIPMAMYSWPMMPPPRTVDKVIGERRITNFTPVGISLCEELNVEAVLQGIADKEEQVKALALAAENAVVAEYKNLEDAILHPDKRTADYTQPWKQ